MIWIYDPGHLKVTEYRPLTKVWISVVWFVLLLVGNLTLLVSKLLEDKLLQLGSLFLNMGKSILAFERGTQASQTHKTQRHTAGLHGQLISLLQKDYLVELLLQQLVAFHHLLHLLQQAPHLKAKVVIK